MIYLKNGDIKEVQAALSNYLTDKEQIELFVDQFAPDDKGIEEELEFAFAEGGFYSQTKNSFAFNYTYEWMPDYNVCEVSCRYLHSAFQRLKKQFPELVIHETACAAEKYMSFLAVYSADSDSKEVKMEQGTRCDVCREIVPEGDIFFYLDDWAMSRCFCSITCAFEYLCKAKYDGCVYCYEAVELVESDYQCLEEKIHNILKNQPEKYLNEDNIGKLIEICKDRVELRAELIDAYSRVNRDIKNNLPNLDGSPMAKFSLD